MKQSSKIIISLLLAFITLILAIVIGSVHINAFDIFNVILNKTAGIPLAANIDRVSVSIIWNLRLPRTLLAFLVGSALAVSGAVMQSVLKNPLASSYTLGVSSGSAFGASLVMIFNIVIPFLGHFTLPFFGLSFGLATVFISISFASKVDKNMENNTIILTGMVLSLFINALIMLFISIDKDNTQKLVLWQMGSFSLKEWSDVWVLAPIVILSILFLMKYTRELDIMTFGEEQAQSIGVELKKVKWILISTAAIITGSAISFVGVIGFIDLFTSHFVRKIFGSSHKYVVPMSALFGGIFMVASDTIARTVLSPSELPVGSVTALIGAPFFAYIYLKRNKRT